MNHVRQLKPNNCGQTCLEIITGVPALSIAEVIGKTCITTGKDLRRFLNLNGYTTTAMRRMPKSLLNALHESQVCAQTFICSLRKDKFRHWIILEGKYFYDPAMENKMRIRSYLKRLEKTGSKIVSYFVVTRI